MSTGNAPFQLETVINVTYEQNRLAHRCIRESVKHAALGEKAAGGAELEPEAVLVHRGDLANCSVCKRVSRNRLVETIPYFFCEFLAIPMRWPLMLHAKLQQ